MDETTTQKVERSISLEIQPVKEALQEEFGRRVYELHAYVSDLEEILEASVVHWFIVPPVMNRTDFGYTSDVDFVVLLPSDARENHEQISTLTQRYAEEREVFLTPNFITEKELEEMKTHIPEMYSWYQKQFNKPKPEEEKTKYNGFFDQSGELESKLREFLPSAEKERLRQERLEIAGQFIKEAGAGVEIVTWTVSGSTASDSENFGICSDLDLEILTDPKNEDQERANWKYLHQYLTWKYAENKSIKIDCGEWTVGHLRQFSEVNPKMREFFERMFGIELEGTQLP